MHKPLLAAMGRLEAMYGLLALTQAVVIVLYEHGRFCQPSCHWLTWRRLGGWHSVGAEWNKAGYRDELRVLWVCGRDGAAGGDGPWLPALPVPDLRPAVQ